MGYVKKVFVESLSKTSIKGVPRIIQHDAMSLKVFWLVGVLGLVGIAIFTLSQLIMQYLAFATTTTIRTRELFGQTNLSAISLVVCNRQPVSQTGLNNNGDIITFKQYKELLETQIPRNEETQELLDDLSLYSGYYQYIGKENASRLGHQRDTFVADCRWLYASSSTTIKRRKCQTEQIRLVSSPRFYNCFKMPIVDSTFRAGLPVGISLLLYLDRPLDKYFVVDNLLESSGILMSLGFSDAMNDYLYTSLDVRPGESTKAQVKVEERILLSSPYSSCVSDILYKDLDGHNVSYTMPGCLNACVQDKIFSACKCIDPELLVVSSSDLLDQPFCYSKKAEHVLSAAKCMETVLMENACFSYDICPQGCEDHTFQVTLTHSEWPLGTELSLYSRVIGQGKVRHKGELLDSKTLQELMGSGNRTSAEEELLESFIHDNFAKVSLILSSTYVTVLKEVPSLTWESLTSQVGGALNLYSGISLVVCLEILELLYKLFGGFFIATEAQQNNQSNNRASQSTKL